MSTNPCTAQSLGLPTTALTRLEVQKLAMAKWGSGARVSQIWNPKTSSTGTVSAGGLSTVMVGFMDPFGHPIWQGIDHTGSWRKAWNNVLIDECVRRNQ